MVSQQCANAWGMGRSTNLCSRERHVPKKLLEARGLLRAGLSPALGKTRLSSLSKDLWAVLWILGASRLCSTMV